MSRLFFAAFLQLVLASAASAQVVSPKVKMPGFSREISLDTLVYSRATVSAAPDVAFAALRGVYAQLKIPQEIADSAQGLVSTIRFRTSSSLGGERFSTYLRCGVGLEGDNADTWQLMVAIASFLTPTGDGRTKIGTGFIAGARSNGGAAKEPVLCASTGELEARIARMLAERLANRPQ
ncbi:MAG: hypothetical protein U0132_23535 [Gemmatimonadaceae bacterium]